VPARKTTSNGLINIHTNEWINFHTPSLEKLARQALRRKKTIDGLMHIHTNEWIN